MNIDVIFQVPVPSWRDSQIKSFIEDNPLGVDEYDCYRLQHGGGPVGPNQQKWKEVFGEGRSRGIIGFSYGTSDPYFMKQWDVRCLTQ